MVRNTGNVMGTVLAAAIVTAAMVSRGLPPVLAASASTPQVAEAFIAGMRVAYLVPAILAVLGLLLYLLPSGRTVRGQPRFPGLKS